MKNLPFLIKHAETFLRKGKTIEAEAIMSVVLKILEKRKTNQ